MLILKIIITFLFCGSLFILSIGSAFVLWQEVRYMKDFLKKRKINNEAE